MLSIQVRISSQPQRNCSLAREIQPMLRAEIQPGHTSATLLVARYQNTSVLIDKKLMLWTPCLVNPKPQPLAQPGPTSETHQTPLWSSKQRSGVLDSSAMIFWILLHPLSLNTIKYDKMLLYIDDLNEVLKKLRERSTYWDGTKKDKRASRKSLQTSKLSINSSNHMNFPGSRG